MKGFESWFVQYVEEKGLTVGGDELAFDKDAMQNAFEAGFNKASFAVRKAISEEAENDGAGETAANAKSVMNLLKQPLPLHGLQKAANLGNPLKVGDLNKTLSEMLKKKK